VRLSPLLSTIVLSIILVGCETDPIVFGPSTVIEETGLQDRDNDGYDETIDCNDQNPSVHPDADEICDNIDNDCDDETDEPGAIDGDPYYVDGDGDSYGNSELTELLCELTEGYSEVGDDCDDDDEFSYPGAEELCDGADNDCNLLIDDGTDADSDSFDNVCGGDCDDDNENINPSVDEICDGDDNNCDGQIDEDSAVDATTWYADDDLDGFGDQYDTITSCEQPEGYVLDDQDCNDYSDEAYPGAIDLLDGLDNDCDGHRDWVDLGDVEAKLVGTSANSLTGYAVSSLGDIDGDGYDDIAIGATNESNIQGTQAGAAYVVHGPISGSTSLGNANAMIFGEVAESYAGRSLASCDFDNDGYADMALGAWGDSTYDTDAGAVYITYGPFPATSTIADARLIGESASDYAGWTIACAGDVNGDNNDDLLVSAPNYDDTYANVGAVYLLHGPFAGEISLGDADAIIVGEAGGDLLGASVSSAGDLNNDGMDDILIGATSNDAGGSGSGATYLLYSPLSGTVSLADGDADAKFIGEESGDTARIITNAGDVDGDGYNDILIGALLADASGVDRGRAYLFYGPYGGDTDLSTADVILDGQGDNAWAGTSVASAGDIDNDGYDDILIGAPSNGAGLTYLFYGPVSTGNRHLGYADAIFFGESNGDSSGWAVSAAGDVNNDSWGDILIGAKSEPTGGTDAGAVYVVLGGGR